MSARNLAVFSFGLHGFEFDFFGLQGSLNQKWFLSDLLVSRYSTGFGSWSPCPVGENYVDDAVSQ